ncbi:MULTISPECIES: ATP-binding cassette domain-containing protein [Gordonia]|uniref:ABC transporter domain-containing protein n=2 Tax=Gordonia TaxID=2053 RepID=L7LR80_9ACTN|nr:MULTISPECIES: ATP-binding cassette domain-containing protein [Gordonia]AUH70135.1 hypothetical protein CXX93_05025 [Gordonia sp. YC-JH1]KJR06136.1 hypothetical protein UG54_14585 [Gordonia sihwensis]KXT58258.1 hypothetical protein Y710_04070 [Gordonia sp. QH-12]MBY4570836.1 hypothetical protein [Gordonia sihwensis]GAC62568.1 hypothetical protein GSI01S_38_00150 [Gordonia sihwensis NBRC 108236]
MTIQYETAAFDTDPLLHGIDLGVDASWGHIYGPVEVTVPRGGVTVLQGSGGRGRTALLLTLCGRMRPTKGTLTAFGRTDDAHHLFNHSAMAFIDEVDGIEQTIRVRDVLTEQLRWHAPWYRWVKQAREDDLERICRPVFGDDLQLPPLMSYVEELPELTAALFRIAVANIGRSELLVVGGVDNLTRVENSNLLLDRLVALGREQTVVTADVNGAPAHRGLVRVERVDNLTDREFVRLEPADRNI